MSVVKYNQYTVRVSGYKYCIVNARDDSELKKIQEQMPGISVISDKYHITAPHIVFDVHGHDIMHIYTRVQHKLLYVFNEYIMLRRAPEILILRNKPTVIHRGTAGICSVCCKKIHGYYAPQYVCILCVSAHLLNSSILYTTPKYRVKQIEKRNGILMDGSIAYIFCNKIRDIGLINYLVQHINVLSTATEIYLYDRRMKSFYLEEFKKSEYTSD